MRFPSLALASILSLEGLASGTEPLGPEAAFGRLPLLFEANGGHYGPQVAFVSRARGYRLFLTPDAMTLALETVVEGDDGAPFTRLEIEGAAAGSLIYLVASTQMNPAWLPKIDATLVPLFFESLTLLIQDPESDLELYVPGLSGGPFSVFLQAVAADQGGSTPWHTSNALQIDVP
jgi:hypothetical protein